MHQILQQMVEVLHFQQELMEIKQLFIEELMKIGNLVKMLI